MEEEMVITIRITRPDGRWASTHELKGIGEFEAGIILIDVGRDLLAALASHHHHEHAPGENGQGVTSGQ